ncbi:MAG: DUF2569 domain-containing protein [Spirochaetes bacterium]|nr:DUF2569 domain-containing protein [Spirochaetota bacterium]
MQTDENINGLKGWLIVVLLGIIISLVTTFYSMMANFFPIFTNNYWDILTQPGSSAYHPLWGPTLIFEIIGHIIFCIFCVILICLFFMKHFRFPMTYIAFRIIIVLYSTADLILVNLIPAASEANSMQPAAQLGKSILGAGIWITYMVSSNRVQNTFIKKEVPNTNISST